MELTNETLSPKYVLDKNAADGFPSSSELQALHYPWETSLLFPPPLREPMPTVCVE
jgi:hypothetical protein